MNRPVVVLVGIGLAASVAAFVLAQAGETRTFCMSVPGGLATEHVHAFAHDAGYRTEQRSSATLRISSARSLHRYGCQVELVGGRVRSVTYVGATWDAALDRTR